MSFLPYYLDSNSPSLGINREDFTAPFGALIASSSKDNKTKIFKLMRHSPKEGYYLFENEYITLYDATMPTSKSSSLIEIKPVKVFENKSAELILSKAIKEKMKIDNIYFQIRKKEKENTFQGLFSTTSSIKETFERGKLRYKIGVDFIIPQYFILLETINIGQINLVFQKLSKWNERKLENILCKKV